MPVWQDIVLTAGSIFFALSLIPELRECMHGGSVNVVTAICTTLVLYLYCVAYLTMGLTFAALPFTASVWTAITYYSIKNRR